ncbi:hypothetical protein QQX09_07755 [Demequina sp. SYSU T00192]|uniref:PknH-like extracellular domain-containing protein n=1 Tax=Demequina litoralis TaxID=3051660 RepID=A0ABT8G9D6_9MICO|nr:hypothetical protein [Demequina sp. SYSU T00192]MDN4475748.1 hypothetical protein [Demequina sp. SYSU T00192]
MTEELGDVLDEVAGDEERAFAAAHRGDETGLYVRAIVPRRRARWTVPALAGVAAVGALGLAFALGPARDEAAPVGASAEAAATVAADPDAVPGEAGWSVGGLVVDPTASAGSLAAAVGDVSGTSSACPALETFGSLEGGSDWSTGVHVGAFVQDDGAANDLHVRRFENVEVASRYLGELKRIADTCAAAVAEWGTTATVLRHLIEGLDGEAVAVAMQVRGTRDAWRLWVHVDGTEAVAVVADPGAPDLGAAIIRAWIHGARR